MRLLLVVLLLLAMISAILLPSLFESDLNRAAPSVEPGDAPFRARPVVEQLAPAAAPSESVVLPAATAPVRSPDPAPAADLRQLVHYHGQLWKDGKGLGDREWMLEVDTQREPVFLNGEGAFSFVLKRATRSATLRDESGVLILKTSDPPLGEQVYVNIDLSTARVDQPPLIEPRVIIAEQALNACRLSVYGSTLLSASDADNRISIALRWKDAEIWGNVCDYRGGTMLGELVMERAVPFSGFYDVELGWRRTSASPEEIARLEQLTKSVLSEEIAARGRIYLGLRTLEDKEERKIEEYYRQFIDEAVHSQYLIYHLANKLRGEKLEIPENFLDATLERAEEKDVAGVLSPSKPDKDAWRNLLTSLSTELRPFSNHAEVPYRDKYPKLAELSGQVYSKLIGFLKLESQMLYSHLGWSKDMRDFTKNEFDDTVTEWKFVRDQLKNAIQSLRKGVRDRRSG